MPAVILYTTIGLISIVFVATIGIEYDWLDTLHERRLHKRVCKGTAKIQEVEEYLWSNIVNGDFVIPFRDIRNAYNDLVTSSVFKEFPFHKYTEQVVSHTYHSYLMSLVPIAIAVHDSNYDYDARTIVVDKMTAPFFNITTELTEYFINLRQKMANHRAELLENHAANLSINAPPITATTLEQCKTAIASIMP